MTQQVKKTTSNSNQKGSSTSMSNLLSWLAPFVCIFLGFIIWRFVLGNADNFAVPDPEGGFWPHHKGPKDALSRMYEGGIIVPLLIGLLFIVFFFAVERLLTILKASGKRSRAEFIKTIEKHLEQKNVDAAIKECDNQKGSLANVAKAGLLAYKKMTEEKGANKEQKLASIQKELQEATMLELPMLEKNLIFLSTLTSLSTLVALLGTVIGMIRAFAALGEEGGAGAATELAVGISEALYNTALGIGTGAIALTLYNFFTTRIDIITYGIDEAGQVILQDFAANH